MRFQIIAGKNATVDLQNEEKLKYPEIVEDNLNPKA